VSAATRAKSARERANIAARFIRRGSKGSRAFADCFEMGDGDEVAKILVQKAQTDKRLANFCVYHSFGTPEQVQALCEGLTNP